MTNRTRRLLRALHKALLLRALHEAVEDGNLETVSHIVKTTSVDIEGILPEVAVAVNAPVAFAGRETALLKACCMGDLAVVKCLITAGRANIGATNSSQSTSLHLAAGHGYFGVAHYLLQQANGAELIAAKDVALLTALHYAAIGNSVDVALLLIQVAGDRAGELVHATGRDKQTALHLATSALMVQVLVNVGGQSLIYARTSAGQTALHAMAAKDNVDAVCRLLDLCDVAHGSGDDDTGPPPPPCGQTETAESKQAAVAAGTTTTPNVQAGDQRGRVGLIMARDKSGGTALHEAAYLGCYDMAKVLVAEGGMDLVLAVDNDGFSALQFAAENDNVGSFNTAKHLLKEGGDQLLYATNKHGENAFHRFAMLNRMDVVDYMVNVRGVDVNIVDGKGNTALLHIVHLIKDGRRDVDMLAHLVRSHHANVNLCDARGRTALHILCSPSADLTVDVLASVQLIVQEGGADVHAVDNHRRTALHYACKYGNVEMVDYLVNRAEANIFAVDNFGLCPLHDACATHMADTLKKARLLVEANGGNGLVDATDNAGGTPLHYVASLGNFETAEYFVNDAAANIHVADRLGQTALHYACSNRKAGKADALAIARLLVNAGVNVFATNGNGRTALNMAASSGQNVGVILLLLALFEPM